MGGLLFADQVNCTAGQRTHGQHSHENRQWPPAGSGWLGGSGWGGGLGKLDDGGAGSPGFSQRRTGVDGFRDQSGRGIGLGIAGLVAPG